MGALMSGRGQAKGCVATFVERKTRLYIGIKMPNRSAASMDAAIRKLYHVLPKIAFQTFTTDWGKKFSCYATIESDLKIPVYFCDAYSAWQRGSNENSNGLLREFSPKRTNFDFVSQNQLQEAVALIINRPRKCLDWKTPHEAFSEELLHLI